jgi:hypothetical protein
MKTVRHIRVNPFIAGLNCIVPAQPTILFSSNDHERKRDEPIDQSVLSGSPLILCRFHRRGRSRNQRALF